MDHTSFSTYYLQMIPYGSEIAMSTATGFVYQSGSILYLITNGHNFTRLNCETNERITASAAFPVKVKTKFRGINPESPDMIGTVEFSLNLYEDEEHQKPKWLIHPEYGYKVDVVAMEILDLSTYTGILKFYPINKFDYSEEFPIRVSDDVFILGYPFNVTGGSDLPIWKRGSIATEPSIDIDNLPKYLIDTASRSGMSGSPVVMQRSGFHMSGNQISTTDILGVIRNFAGIYSGRIGAKDNFDVQLGIVWKPHVIEEIIKGNRYGDVEFQDI